MALLVRTRPGISAFSSACSLPISLDHRRGRDCSSAPRTLGPGLAGGVFTIPAFRQPLQARALSTSKFLAKEEDDGFFGKSKMIAPDGFERWKTIPPVMALQVSIGSIYAWSIFNSPLTRDLGVIEACSTDWGLGDIVPIFSTTAVVFGVSVWKLGKYIERIGPRKAGAIAAVCWGGGLITAGVGATMHALPLLYAGYGCLGGLGFAFGYIAPIANLTTWFPDKKGMATGAALTAFGGGALVCAPLSEKLMQHFAQVPDMIGNIANTPVVTKAGAKFVEVGGQMKEVIQITGDNLNAMPGLVEGGLYATGTGDTGVGPTFMALGAGYMGLMMAGTLGQKSLKPVVSEAGAAPVAQEPYVPLEMTTKMPQFYLIWLGVMGNAMAGVAIISCAKTIMIDVFGSQLPLYVDGAFAAAYVAGLSVANLGGRLFWAASSDKIGRRNVYMTFGLLGVPIAASLPTITGMMAIDPTVMPLWAFVGASSALVSFYGGLLGILPAYVSDTFGAKNTPSIFGRCMTGWATAALIGPRILTHFRESEYNLALRDLSAKVDPATFQQTFGESVENLDSMIAAKSITIPKLMELCPSGTLDPTVSIYNPTMYIMSGALGAALVCNYMVKPIEAKYLITDETDPAPETKTK